jgi:hypothetical protein
VGAGTTGVSPGAGTAVVAVAVGDGIALGEGVALGVAVAVVATVVPAGTVGSVPEVVRPLVISGRKSLEVNAG